MPASAHAATSGSPYVTYGPTVVISTRVDDATARSESGSVTSACSSGRSISVALIFDSRRRRYLATVSVTSTVTISPVSGSVPARACVV